MKKTILTFGVISGVISSVLMAATVPFAHKIGFSMGLVMGYTTMVLSFLMVFFGIRSYRDGAGNGQITFTKAFAIGICITLISCLFYVGTWEVIYFKFMPDFLTEYNAHVIEKLKASGATDAAIQAKTQELNHLATMYQNPLINAAMTFVEPFPVGLVITLFSAGVLRRKQQTGRSPQPAT